MPPAGKAGALPAEHERFLTQLTGTHELSKADVMKAFRALLPARLDAMPQTELSVAMLRCAARLVVHVQETDNFRRLLEASLDATANALSEPALAINLLCSAAVLVKALVAALEPPVLLAVLCQPKRGVAAAAPATADGGVLADMLSALASVPHFAGVDVWLAIFKVLCALMRSEAVAERVAAHARTCTLIVSGIRRAVARDDDAGDADAGGRAQSLQSVAGSAASISSSTAAALQARLSSGA